MKKNSKIWLVITGVLFIVLGVVCICNPAETLFSMAWLIGCFTLFAGISKLVFGLRTQNFLPNNGTRVLMGVIDIIFGLFFLANSIFVAASLPYMFAFWIVFEGISQFISAFDYKKMGFSGWWGVMLFGIAGAVLGFFALKYPEASGKTLSTLFGCSLVLIGIAHLTGFFGIRKLEKRVGEVKTAVREAIEG